MPREGLALGSGDGKVGSKDGERMQRGQEKFKVKHVTLQKFMESVDSPFFLSFRKTMQLTKIGKESFMCQGLYIHYCIEGLIVSSVYIEDPGLRSD